MHTPIIRRNGLALTLFLAKASFASPYLRTFHSVETGHEGSELGSPEFFYHLVISIVLVLAGGVFAGLTIGVMGLDELHLRVLAISSQDKTEKAHAQKVLQLLEKGRHWVLVVLLLANVIVNESLPIFLDSALGGGFAAIAISTAAIVVFGIIPQAICVRYGLRVGAACAPLVLSMMYIFAPIAYPIAKLLDYVLGADHHHTYKKAELKSFLQFHKTGEEPLRDDELAILNGVLELNSKDVQMIMTPLSDVRVLSANAILDHAAVAGLLKSGYSRIPVHEPASRTAFIGLLLVKQLLTYDPSKALPVSAFPLSILPEAHTSINCFQALDYFQTGRAHLLLVSSTPGKAGGAMGVLTLEDIIEEIISEEIVDETDLYEDNRSKITARRTITSTIMRGIVERRRPALSMVLPLPIPMPVAIPQCETWDETSALLPSYRYTVHAHSMPDHHPLFPDYNSTFSSTDSGRRNLGYHDGHPGLPVKNSKGGAVTWVSAVSLSSSSGTAV